MKYLIASLLLAFLGGIARAAQLDVRIEKSVGASNRVLINLIVSNTSKKPTCLDASIVGLDSEILRPVFKVARNGTEVNYIGVQASRLPGSSIIISPGRVVSISLDLTDDYDFSEFGEYSLQYDFLNISNCAELRLNEFLKSNVLILTRSSFHR